MLKMKLPMRTAEEGEDTAEDEQEQPDLHIPGSVSTSASDKLQESSEGQGVPFRLNKESVYEWFGLHLNPAKRVEFMYGLLHMCQPLELRFLGSCLEDLARKDYHVLRDFEIRANSPNDLGLLADVIDPVVRSKLLVCLSLLGSDNRDCAGILFRILSHVDPALYYKNYGLPISSFRDPQYAPFRSPCGDGDEFGRSDQGQGCGPFVEAGVGLLEQLALLFTMASLHPAFHFHQRETVRMQLDKVELAVEEQTRQQNQHHTNAQQNKMLKTEYLSPITETSVSERTQAHRSAQPPPSRRAQMEAVHIEKIVLKGISRSRTDREYSFEVKWSDSSSSSVTKTHLELENFLLKLPKEQATESFERGILRLLNQGEKYENREVERTLKEKFLSAPQSFRQTGKVSSFFLCDSSSSSSMGCSRCNHIPLGKSFKEDCSEASSQEEDLEPYVQGHRKKPGSKSPSLSITNAKSSQAESRRAPHSSEHNGLPEWRRKNCAQKPTQEPSRQGPEQQHPGGERRNASTKTKPRAPPPDREKGKKGEGRVAYIANGVMVHRSDGKDVRLDVGSGQDTYGETSSESSSSPSSPQHDGRESLDSEDEKDKDTDSHSDDFSKSGADPFLPCKVAGGVAVATVHPLVSVKQGGQALRPVSPLSTVGFPPLSFHPVPCMVQNEPEAAPSGISPQATDVEAGPGLITAAPAVLPSRATAAGGAEKRPPETPVAAPSFGVSGLGLQPPGSPAMQPLVQRFKTAGPQASAESGAIIVPPTHQPPVGAISVIPVGPTYPSPLQPAYPSTDPGTSSVLLVEPHAKPPGLALPSGLPPPFSLPIPTSTMPTMGPMGSVGTPSASQVPAAVPPAVPTHTPGPAPSPSPALTHSTAQSDSTSYVNSSACSSSGNGIAQQQPQPATQQPLGCQQPCNACGCRGSCSSSSHPPNYLGAPNYFQQMPPRQMFGMPPIFHLTPLCSSSYLSQPPQSNGATQLPFFTPAPAPAAYAGGALLHPHGHSHSDHVLSTQAAGYGLQQMAAFNRYYQPVYPSTVGMVPGGGVALGGVGGINKKNGNVSCYNCGVSGHYAQDCKQPPIDATQQGGFRLKYVSSHSSEALDNNAD